MNISTEIVDIKELRTASNDELKAELAKSLEITSRHLRYLAKIWRELESRGEDMSNLRHGLMAYLPMIADERVDPRLIVNYAGQKTLLSFISQLPNKVQKEIAETGYVTLVKIDEGISTEVQTQLSKLSVSEIHRVFDIDRKSVRTPDEQRLILESPKKKNKKLPHITRFVGFERRNEQDLIIVSGKRVSVNTVISAMMEQYPDLKEDLSNILNSIQ